MDIVPASRIPERLMLPLRRAGWPALAMVVMLACAGYALFGSNGLLAYGDYTRQLRAREAQLAKLQAEQAELRNRVALLDPRHANPDLVDELVRRQLNVVHPDEVILPIR